MRERTRCPEHRIHGKYLQVRRLTLNWSESQARRLEPRRKTNNDSLIVRL